MSFMHDHVAYIRQPDRTTCWLAAAAMVIHWRAPQPGMGLDKLIALFAEKVRSGSGLLPEDFEDLMARTGLRQVPHRPAAPWTAEELEGLVQQYGPLFSGTVIEDRWGDSIEGSHAIVLLGIGPGEAYYHDPWDGPMKRYSVAVYLRKIALYPRNPLLYYPANEARGVLEKLSRGLLFKK